MVFFLFDEFFEQKLAQFFDFNVLEKLRYDNAIELNKTFLFEHNLYFLKLSLANYGNGNDIERIGLDRDFGTFGTGDHRLVLSGE